MMAGSELVSNVLGSSEFSTLSQPIIDKLQCHLSVQKEQLEEWKSKFERLRVNSEQKYFDIEKQLLSSNTKLQTELERSSNLDEKLSDLEQKFVVTSKKVRSLEESEEGSLSTQLRLTKRNEHLEAEKRDLAILVEKKSKEIERLNEEFKVLSERASTANNAKCEAMAKLDELQSRDVLSKYREKRLEEENTMLQKQYDWLNTELDKKGKELIDIRKEKASNLLEVTGKLDEKTEEVKLLQEVVDTLRVEKENQVLKIKDLIGQLKETNESAAQSEELRRQQLQSQTKLTDLYKEAGTEAESKNAEMIRGVEEMRRLLLEAKQAYEDLENRRSEATQKHGEELAEKDAKIQYLDQELSNANALMRTAKFKGIELTEEGIEALSPAAAAASKLLKSGMTLTQIYNEYVQATDSLEVEKEENARLNEYINQIIQEIEEKAPLMKKQREDYETSLQTISQMTRQLDVAMLECEKTRTEADDSRRKSNHFQREGQKVKQQNVDLSQQVRYLVKEVEELRGGRVVHDTMEVSSSDVSSSSQAISERLVSFRNIEELQEQNQKLLEVVRGLSEKLEEEEKEATDSRIAELKEQLSTALEEVDELKCARTRQREMVESIVRQRDMYRVLLAQTGTALPSLSPSLTSTPHPPTTLASSVKSPGLDTSKILEDTRAALAELRTEYDTYKREKAENEKILNEQLERQRQEVSSFRVQNAKLASQLDYSSERYKVLQGNTGSFKKEIASLRDKNQKYTASIVKHEMTINTLREELMSKQERTSRLEVQCQNLRMEKELVKRAEERLLQEKENMLREQSSQNILLTSLQTIQNNLERTEYETKAKLGQQIERLEKECNSLRRKLDAEGDQHRSSMHRWEAQVRELRGQLDQELKNHQTTREHLSSAATAKSKMEREMVQLQANIQDLETKMLNSSDKSGMLDASLDSSLIQGVNEEVVKDLKAQLNQAQAEIKALRSQVDKANLHATQYKTIADSIEKGLKEQNEVSKKFKDSLETKLQEVERQKALLDKQMLEVDKDKQGLMNENIRISEESYKMNAELRKQLSSLQIELEEAVQRRALAVTAEQTARTDCQTQAKIATDAQDKYERELMLHAADVEALTSIRKELDGFNKKLEEALQTATKSQNELEESKVSWTEQERLVKEECTKIEARCQELTQQNSVLHEQMSKLSTQVVSIQQAAVSSAKEGQQSTSLLTGDETEKSSEQLLEIIRFLRREKEIAETKLEVVQTETNRLRQHSEHVEKQLADANHSLMEERGKSQVSLQTAAQHRDLMRKVENLNLLSDSNQLLREEKEKLNQQVRELETKVQSLEDQIAPLQRANRDMQAQKDAMSAERTALHEEVHRWKNRTNHLIEQCNKADPEEQRRLVQERDNLRKQHSSQTEELYKHRAEGSKMSASLQAAQKEIFDCKQQIGILNTEIGKLKKQLLDKANDIEEKMRTINQLKRIGRKYKEQTEKISKELDDSKAELVLNKAAQQQQQQQAASSSILEQTTTAAMNEKLQTAEKERDEAKEKLQAWELQLNSGSEQMDKLQKELETLKVENTKLKEENSEFETKQTQSRNVLQTAKNRITAQKNDIEKLAAESKEAKDKLAASEKNKDEADQKSATLKSQLEEKVSRLEQELHASLQQTTTISEPLGEMQQNMDKLRRENTELQARVQQLHKLIESQKKQGVKPAQTQRTPTASAAERMSMSTSEASRTANIRPMATPTTATRQTAQGASNLAAAKATASIRPMAITPVTTPTATVMPTTASSQEPHEEVSSSSSSVPSAGTVQGRPAQRVAPQVEIITEPEPSSSDLDMIGESPATATVEPQPSTSSPAIVSPGDVQLLTASGKRPREPESQEQDTERDTKKSKTSLESVVLPTITVTDEDPPPVPIVDDSERTSTEPMTSPVTQEADPQNSAAQVTTSTAQVTASTAQVMPTVSAQVAAGESFHFTSAVSAQTATPASRQEAAEIKHGIAVGQQREMLRTPRVTERVEASPVVTIEQTGEVTLVGQPVEDSGIVEELGEEGAGVEPSLAWGKKEEEEYVIVVDSDDDDDGAGEEELEEEEEDVEDVEEEDEEDEEGEEEEYMEEIGEEEEVPPDMPEDEEFEGEMEEEEEEDYDEDQEDMQEDMPEDDDDDDDDDVVIVDLEDNAEAQMETHEESESQTTSQEQQMAPAAPPTTGQRPPPPLQPILPVPHTERLPSTSGRSQPLTPFLFGGQPGAYEEGDDCTVPSTPTLFVPRRGDGFAEAVSSPHVPQRFVFGSGLEAGLQPELAQLASQGALGMDNTTMDLSQFDEGGVVTAVPVSPALILTSPATTPALARPTLAATRPATMPSTVATAPADTPSISATALASTSISATAPASIPSILATAPAITVDDIGLTSGQTEQTTTQVSMTDPGQMVSIEADTGESTAVILEMTEPQPVQSETDVVVEQCNIEAEPSEDNMLGAGDVIDAASPGRDGQEDDGLDEPSGEGQRVGSPSQQNTAGVSRPRIQRIVWDNASASQLTSQTQPPGVSPTPGPMIRPPPGRERVMRGVYRGPSVHRGSVQRGVRGPFHARGYRSTRGRRGAF